MNLSSLPQRLRDRKLAQWALAYLAGAWVALQLFTTLSQNFAWPSVVIRVITVALGFGLLPVLVLAYYHGERGEQRVSGVELLILTALLAVGGGVLTLTGAAAPGAAGETAVGGASPDSASAGGIAVLPFDNLSSNAENAYFADGMMEDILTSLSQIQDLRVIPRTSVEEYRETTKSLRTIARELGVAHVVEGSVRRDGNRVRIRAQLTRASTEQPLWAMSFDRDLTDIFAVQSEISQEIAEALRIRLSQGEQARLERKPTENLLAYDAYLRARELTYRRSRQNNEGALALYKRALELDPSFHLAATGLAGAYSYRTNSYGFGPEWADSGVALAERTVELAPDLAQAHHTLGFTRGSRGEADRAEAEYRRALELDPNHGPANNNLGGIASGRGDLVEALRRFEAASKLEPRGYVPRTGTIGIRLSLNDLAGADTAVREFAERFPERQADVAVLKAQLALARGRHAEVLALSQGAWQAPETGDSPDPRFGALLLFSGHIEQAATFLERAIATSTVNTRLGPDARILLGYIRLQRGDRARAEELFTHPLSVAAVNRSWVSQAQYTRAALAAARGRNDEALQLFESAVRAGWTGWVLGRYNPMFVDLRGNPRYEALMVEVKGKIDRQRAEAQRLGVL